MRLKIGQVFNAVQALDAIIRRDAPMPQIGKFRVARLHRQLLPDFATANERRDEMVKRFGARRDDGQTEVLPERMADFAREWELFAAGEIEVDVEPLRLVDVTLGTAGEPTDGAIKAIELAQLGDLVTE